MVNLCCSSLYNQSPTTIGRLNSIRAKNQKAYKRHQGTKYPLLEKAIPRASWRALRRFLLFSLFQYCQLFLLRPCQQAKAVVPSQEGNNAPCLTIAMSSCVEQHVPSWGRMLLGYARLLEGSPPVVVSQNHPHPSTSNSSWFTDSSLFSFNIENVTFCQKK